MVSQTAPFMTGYKFSPGTKMQERSKAPQTQVSRRRQPPFLRKFLREFLRPFHETKLFLSHHLTPLHSDSIASSCYMSKQKSDHMPRPQYPSPKKNVPPVRRAQSPANAFLPNE